MGFFATEWICKAVATSQEAVDPSTPCRGRHKMEHHLLVVQVR